MVHEPVQTDEDEDVHEGDSRARRNGIDIEMTRAASPSDPPLPENHQQDQEQYHSPLHHQQQMDEIYEQSKQKLHRFFFPKRFQRKSNDREHIVVPSLQEETNQPGPTTDEDFVRNFWKSYDDILILFVFTQVGVVARLASSTWFTIFDNVFHANSALFVNLPLNCLSCFIMGMLCSGEQLMEIITTRFSPPTTQHSVLDLSESSGHRMMQVSNGEGASPTVRRRRKTDRQERFTAWQPPTFLHQELRDVQLLALERRIRMSKCLLLFPLKPEDVDFMEHYFNQGYKKDASHPFHDLELNEFSGRSDPHHHSAVACALDEQDDDDEADNESNKKHSDPLAGSVPRSPQSYQSGSDNGDSHEDPHHKVLETRSTEDCSDQLQQSPQPDEPLPQHQSTAAMTTEVMTEFANTMTENVQTLRRVNLADGWDSGTTPEAMSDDLILGLRDGFCGALSSFSSWNSSMVRLLRNGHIGEAFVGYMLGLQLPIIAYRFGQHVAVYVFVWRTRRETQKAERRGGYGIQISSEEQDLDDEEEEDEVPSVRAVITAIFIMALVTQCTSISFFTAPDDQLIALSLLFSPLGVLARWRLSKLNKWRPNFPLGTFSANMLACALSGSLGSLLAGNPGPRERILLVSIIAGFGGTLSSLATFVVEILAGIDPILFRFDGMIYAVASIGSALVIGFVFSTSVEWADETSSLTADEGG